MICARIPERVLPLEANFPSNRIAENLLNLSWDTPRYAFYM